ncbi:hypothetical protein KIN20_024548 [Parelaphostrongylus tenuis]|uniref:Uncharacterized protein n=1 Tax=Parelaphostrongylus tenuis TaxID=148309 RepID=A0AAD5MX44_PARTN|nr:hypothetical protein KIN20_024548 [Parelaphostrongylus tenuis]
MGGSIRSNLLLHKCWLWWRHHACFVQQSEQQLFQALIETFGTSIYDQWPSTRRYKWLVSLICCLTGFVCGTLFTTEVSLLLRIAKDSD